MHRLVKIEGSQLASWTTEVLSGVSFVEKHIELRPTEQVVTNALQIANEERMFVYLLLASPRLD